MLVVVPMDKARHPSARLFERGETEPRVARRVLEMAEERLGKSVVVAHAGAAKRRRNAECLHRREHGGAFHRGAVVGVDDELLRVESVLAADFLAG